MRLQNHPSPPATISTQTLYPPSQPTHFFFSSIASAPSLCPRKKPHPTDHYLHPLPYENVKTLNFKFKAHIENIVELLPMLRQLNPNLTCYCDNTLLLQTTPPLTQPSPRPLSISTPNQPPSPFLSHSLPSLSKLLKNRADGKQL